MKATLTPKKENSVANNIIIAIMTISGLAFFIFLFIGVFFLGPKEQALTNMLTRHNSKEHYSEFIDLLAEEE